MKVYQIQPQVVSANWGKVSKILRSAISLDENGTEEEVKAKLTTGEYELAVAEIDHSSMLVVSHIVNLGGVKCLWLPYLAGSYSGSVKGFVSLMRKGMAHYVELARNAGCDEIRIGGRNWARIFPDFERFDDKENRLRKIL